MTDNRQNKGKKNIGIMGGYTILVIAIIIVLITSWVAGNLINSFGQTGAEWMSHYGPEEDEHLGGLGNGLVIPEYILSYLMISVILALTVSGVIIALVDPTVGGRLVKSIGINIFGLILVLTLIMVFMHIFMTRGSLLDFLYGNNGTPPASAPGDTTSNGLPENFMGMLLPLFLIGLLGLFILMKYLNFYVSTIRGHEDEVDYSINTTLDSTMRDLRAGEDVRSTIIRCYQNMCYNLQDQGIKQYDYITPREFRRRAVAKLPVSDRTVGALTTLFEEARYSTHVLGEEHKKRALVTLERLKGELSG